MSVDRYEQLGGLFSGSSFIPIEHKIEQIRLIKTEAELKS